MCLFWIQISSNARIFLLLLLNAFNFYFYLNRIIGDYLSENKLRQSFGNFLKCTQINAQIQIHKTWFQFSKICLY